MLNSAIKKNANADVDWYVSFILVCLAGYICVFVFSSLVFFLQRGDEQKEILFCPFKCDPLELRNQAWNFSRLILKKENGTKNVINEI